MKSINLIENKTKTKKNKIKEAFKKIGEYTLIVATAFSLSCGGVDTDGKSNPINNYPSEIRQYIYENGMNETYDAREEMKVAYEFIPCEELTLLRNNINNYCNGNYAVFEQEFFRDSYLFSFQDITKIKETFFKTVNVDPSNSLNLPEGFKKNNEKVTFHNLHAYSSVDIFYDRQNDLFIYRIDLGGFSYLIEKTKENAKKKPYLLLCSYAYNEDGGIGRFIVMPNQIFWDEVDKMGISHEKIYNATSMNK